MSGGRLLRNRVRANSEDIDFLTTPGTFACENSPNAPNGAGDYLVTVTKYQVYGNPPKIIQTAVKCGGMSRWIRQHTGYTWTIWKELDIFSPTLLASGALPATNSLALPNIPPIFAHLVLKIFGASCTVNTRHLRVFASTNNGVSYDTLNDNYRLNSSANANGFAPGNVNASSAQTHDFIEYIFGYQGNNIPMCQGYSRANTTHDTGTIFYIGSQSPINALLITWNNVLGAFDAGTYALHGAP